MKEEIQMTTNFVEIYNLTTSQRDTFFPNQINNGKINNP